MENDKYRLKLLVIECKYRHYHYKKQIIPSKIATQFVIFVILEQLSFLIHTKMDSRWDI